MIMKRMLPANFGIVLAACMAFGQTSAAAVESGEPPALPYQMAGSNHVIVGVVLDEDSVRRALPPAVKPVKELTGAINIYQVEKGYGITPYQAAYLWVDVEGFDSADGTKGRWMLAGVYGPMEKAAAAMRASGFPVRVGASHFDSTTGGKRGVAELAGKTIISTEISTSDKPCQAVSGTLNYPTQLKGAVVINQIPYVGDVCPAEPRSAQITAPEGDIFSNFKIVKPIWAIELRNASFSFNRPIVWK